MSKNCEYCGIAFTPVKQAGNRQRFCGELCQRAWWSENQKTESKQFTFVCGNCGKEYQTRHSDRNQYCSRECYFIAIEAALVLCVICGKETNGEKYCSDECEHSHKMICQQCGAFYLGKITSVYCSRDCELEVGRERSGKYYISKRETNEYVTKVCKNCGELFTINYYVEKREFCSSRCSNRYHKVQRKARERGAFVEPVSIGYLFNRDGGVCQLCGKKVSMDLEHTHVMSATMDHIIPISKGGRHCKQNTQLAHLMCNSIKGAKDSVLQPLLLG